MFTSFHRKYHIPMIGNYQYKLLLEDPMFITQRREEIKGVRYKNFFSITIFKEDLRKKIVIIICSILKYSYIRHLSRYGFCGTIKIYYHPFFDPIMYEIQNVSRNQISYRSKKKRQ